MNINLRNITNDNWIECIKLTTNKNNTHTVFEEYIASNALSLAQSKVQEGWDTKAIYNNETMVGFAMYGYSYDYNFFEICRLMIDYKFQGCGYGKASLIKIIVEMKKIKDCKGIHICFDPDNIVAQKLYEKVGFKDTERFLKDEKVFKLTLY
ncbi:MAG: GNAT family N-acetyltransferase [Senegalia sp. (in: firmicutes)]|uniref:GNAT family N-acetyltransferase n=1 Tax=Senegalia sp. (in: firmicutes) TaxID=1924098 RepID=UPI003F9D5425